MLPSALRAKYEKIAHIVGAKENLSPQLQALFPKNSYSTNVKNFEKANALSLLKEAIGKGQIDIENSVKQQGNVRRVRVVKIASEILTLQEIVGYRERAGIVHLSRWRREQSGSAVHKLSFCRQGQKGQNQYEGYAFDGAKLAIIFRTTRTDDKQSAIKLA